MGYLLRLPIQTDRAETMMTKPSRPEADPQNPPADSRPLRDVIADIAGTDAVTTLTTDDLGQSRYLAEFLLQHSGLDPDVLLTFSRTLNGRRMTFHTAADASEGYEQYAEAVRESLHGFLEMAAEHHGVLLTCTCPSSMPQG